MKNINDLLGSQMFPFVLIGIAIATGIIVPIIGLGIYSYTWNIGRVVVNGGSILEWFALVVIIPLWIYGIYKFVTKDIFR